MSEVKKLFAETVRFGIVGGISTAVNLGITWVLLKIGMDLRLASGMGYVLGVGVNYFLSNTFVFKTGHSFMSARFLQYVVLFVLGLGVMLAALQAMILLGYPPYPFNQIIAIGIAFIGNFFGARVILTRGTNHERFDTAMLSQPGHSDRKTDFLFIDLDRTITRNDTCLGFLDYVWKREWLVHPFVKLAFIAGGSWKGDVRLLLKGVCIAALTPSRNAERMDAYAAEYAAHVLRNELRPDVMEFIRAKKQAGCRVVVVSASPSFLVRHIAAGIGADDVLATEIKFDPGRGPVFLSPNCRGAEKVRRIRERYNLAGDVVSCGMGDSEADMDMINVCSYGYLVARVMR